MERRASTDRLVTIGRVARATGVAAKTIRYYEQIGVLPRPGRTAAGYRQYDHRAVERLRFIRRARALGLPLGELKTLIGALEGAEPGALRPRLLALVREQLAAVRHRSAELRLLQRHLQRALERLLSAPPRPHADGCRCLETEGERRTVRRPARPGNGRSDAASR
jgi:DNA-binding transcriptional MerR regulator